MIFRKERKTYTLDRKSIDELSMDVQSFLKNNKTANEDVIRLRFSIEEMLLRIFDHMGGVEVRLEMGKSLGNLTIRLTYQGDRFDPEDADMDEWARQTLSNMGQAPSYGYLGGTNSLSYTLPVIRIRTEARILVAIILALIVGSSKAVLPEGFLTGLENFILDPVNTVFTNLINTFAGLMIFLSVIVAICGMGNTATFNKLGSYMMSRYVGLTFVASAFTVALAMPFFGFHTGEMRSSSPVQDIVDLIVSVVPENPVSPFKDGNTLQIIMMAIMIGFIMLALGSRVEQARKVITQINAVVLDVLELVCKLIPAYIFTSLVILFFESGFGIFVDLWKPILICILFVAVFMFYKISRVNLKYGIGFGKLFKKISPGILIGFTTCSSTAAYTRVLDANDNRLGISPEYSRLGIPLGNILYSASVTISFVIMIFHLAAQYSVPVSFTWLVVCWIVCSVIAIATPPIAGGTLVCITLMLTQMGIPMSAMALAGTLSIVFDFITTPALIASGQMELVLQSDHLGILNKEMLRK